MTNSNAIDNTDSDHAVKSQDPAYAPGSESSADVDVSKGITGPSDNKILPLPEDGPNSVKQWFARKDMAETLNEDHSADWDKLQRRYLTKKQSLQNSEEILVPSLYNNVEQKKSQICAQSPKVVVSAKRPESVAAAPLFQAVLNDVLYAAEPDGVDAMVMLNEVMTDMMVSSGIFACHIGYEMIEDGDTEIQIGTQPDPTWVAPPPQHAPAILGLPPQPPPSAPMVPIMKTVPNIIRERYFMSRISPRKLLIPTGFSGALYDRAPWLGYRFRMDEYLARRKWTIPADYAKYAEDDDHIIDPHDQQHSRTPDDDLKQFVGWVFWYYAAIFDPDCADPFAMRCLVLLDGLDEPVYHRDSPYQWKDAQGNLQGMVGNPIHIGALRYVSDSAYPPSDGHMSRFQDEEKSEGRSLMRQQRRRNVPMRIGDISVLKAEGLEKLEKGQYDSIIPAAHECFVGEEGQGPIRTLPMNDFPKENFEFDQICTNDMNETWGLGAAAGGAIPSGQPQSASMTGAATASSQSRIGRERAIFMKWWARAVEKIAPLYQKHITTPQYVNLVGKDGATTLTEWTKNDIPGKYDFNILPNSSIDLSEQRAEELQWYNLVAASPNINRRELDIELVRAFGRDPATLINPIPPPPPPPEPELIKGFTFNATEKDTNPVNPSFPLLIALLTASKIPLPPELIAQMQQQGAKSGLPVASVGNVVDGKVLPNPSPTSTPAVPGAGGVATRPQPAPGIGAAQKVQPIDKHMNEVTGELPNNPGKK